MIQQQPFVNIRCRPLAASQHIFQSIQMLDAGQTRLPAKPQRTNPYAKIRPAGQNSGLPGLLQTPSNAAPACAAGRHNRAAHYPASPSASAHHQSVGWESMFQIRAPDRRIGRGKTDSAGVLGQFGDLFQPPARLASNHAQRAKNAIAVEKTPIISGNGRRQLAIDQNDRLRCRHAPLSLPHRTRHHAP
jgi:hypothetical protein